MKESFVTRTFTFDELDDMGAFYDYECQETLDRDGNWEVVETVFEHEGKFWKIVHDPHDFNGLNKSEYQAVQVEPKDRLITKRYWIPVEVPRQLTFIAS